MCTLQVRGVAIWIIFLCSMCCAGNHGDDNKTNNNTIPEWYFGSVALWHKNRQNGRGSPKGQSTRTALRLVEVVMQAEQERSKRGNRPQQHPIVDTKRVAAVISLRLGPRTYFPGMVCGEIDQARSLSLPPSITIFNVPTKEITCSSQLLPSYTAWDVNMMTGCHSEGLKSTKTLTS